MDNAPKSTQPMHAEVLPPKRLERGGIGTLEEELSRIQEHEKKRQGFIGENAQAYDIDPILVAQREGYKYLLRLPRENERGCVAKYGPYYDKLQSYHDFIIMLAKRSGVTALRHLNDSYYVFVSKEEANILKLKLKEQQENASLEFEIIDND